MLAGVAIGIASGELLLLVADTVPALRISAASFIAMMAAASFGLTAVMIIQAGASAVIVVATSPAAGLERVSDAAVGAALSLLVSQILLTPDPVRIIERSAQQLFASLASSLEESVSSLVRSDEAAAREALTHLFEAHSALVALENAIAFSRGVVRWTVRGRLAAGKVARAIQRYDRRAIRLYAAALLFGDALVAAIHKTEAPPPARLAQDIRHAAILCLRLSGRLDRSIGQPDHESSTTEDADSWRRCVDNLRILTNTLALMSDLQSSTHTAHD